MDKVIDIVGEDYRLSMSGFLFVFRKDMFRDTTFKCRGFAEATVTEEEIMTSGQCGCLDYDLTEVREYIFFNRRTPSKPFEVSSRTSRLDASERDFECDAAAVFRFIRLQ